jgi:hypothetical protein
MFAFPALLRNKLKFLQIMKSTNCLMKSHRSLKYVTLDIMMPCMGCIYKHHMYKIFASTSHYYVDNISWNASLIIVFLGVWSGESGLGSGSHSASQEMPPTFMEPKGSLLCSKPATGSCPQPGECDPHPHTLCFYIPVYPFEDEDLNNI